MQNNDFKLEIDGMSIVEFNLYTILGTIEDFADEDDNFIVLIPKEAIRDSIYLQASVCRRKTTGERVYYVETRIVQLSEYRHYRYKTLDLEEIRGFFRAYYDDRRLPNLSNWEDVTNEF